MALRADSSIRYRYSSRTIPQNPDQNFLSASPQCFAYLVLCLLIYHLITRQLKLRFLMHRTCGFSGCFVPVIYHPSYRMRTAATWSSVEASGVYYNAILLMKSVFINIAVRFIPAHYLEAPMNNWVGYMPQIRRLEEPTYRQLIRFQDRTCHSVRQMCGPRSVCLGDLQFLACTYWTRGWSPPRLYY